MKLILLKTLQCYQIMKKYGCLGHHLPNSFGVYYYNVSRKFLMILHNTNLANCKFCCACAQRLNQIKSLKPACSYFFFVKHFPLSPWLNSHWINIQPLHAIPFKLWTDDWYQINMVTAAGLIQATAVEVEWWLCCASGVNCWKQFEQTGF